MADAITKVRASSSSLGQVMAFKKEKGKYGRGESSQEPSAKPQNQTFSSMSDVSQEKHEKGNLIDIRV